MTKRNTPALRFDGFDDEWDEQPLSAIADRVQTKNTKLTSTLPLTISAVHGLVDQITYFNNRVASSNLTNYLLIHNGEFAYNKSYSEGYPVGAVKRLDGYGMGVLSSLYVVFRLLSERVVDSNFVLSFFETSKWHRYVEMQSAEGGRNHGLLNISADTFMRVPVSLAPSLEEQRAVGELFSDLDALIEQHRAKHANLQQTKSALMQRMFPQDGADEPELRLGEFSGAWVTLPLGDLGTPISGVGFPHSEQGGEVGTPFFKVSDMGRSANERELLFAANYVSAEQIRKRGWQVVNGPAVVFSKVGAAVLLDRKRLVREQFLADNNMMAFALSQTALTPDFALSLFETLSLSSLVQVGALPSINGSQVKAMQVSIPPTLEEQRAIGEVYSNLDALIAAEASYITQLTQAKTALLQRMFV